MTDWSRVTDRWRPVAVIAILGAVAFVIAGMVLAVYGDRLYRSQKATEIEVQAQIIADSVTAALAFDDRSVAQEYVNALRANPEVEAAGVYDDSGALIASYARASNEPPPRSVRLTGPTFTGAHLRVVTPVVQNGARLGAVYLQAATEPAMRRAARYGGAALLALMAALVIAVLGSAHATLTRANRELKSRAHDLAEVNQMLRVQIAERERAEEALRQSQKMEAIGQLTGGVAHDFNNLLMVISSGLDLLDRTTDPRRRDVLRDSIRQALNRGASLTRQLLAFSRRSALKPEIVDLRMQIEGMLLLLERSLREDISVQLELADGLWPAKIDPSQLELALINIAVNARDAMPNGGTIRIAADNRAGLEDGTLAGDFVRLSVSDSGKGIAPEMLGRVFEPFFTTKDVGRGTGLGLSQVYGFARASGGDVRIRSEVGHGTTIILYLPRSLEAPAPKPAETRPEPLRGRGRVLLVEDDESVALLVGEMLVELGYEPVRAASAEEGLRLLDSGETVDLVFSDMVMPGAMSGMDLAREIRRRRPDLPVVLTTGFSEAAAAATAEGLRLLTKPYRIERLAAELEAARTGRRATPGGEAGAAEEEGAAASRREAG